MRTGALGVLNYPPAQIMLGGMYAYGKGVEQDEAQTVAWLLKAANSGNSGYGPADDAKGILGLLRNQANSWEMEKLK
jgi:TPR repeat protein